MNQQSKRPLFEVDVLVGKRVSVARLRTEHGDFLGEAKRAPGDRRNYAVGYNLALGRALQEYGKFLEDAGIARSDALCGHR